MLTVTTRRGARECAKCGDDATIAEGKLCSACGDRFCFFCRDEIRQVYHPEESRLVDCCPDCITIAIDAQRCRALIDAQVIVQACQVEVGLASEDYDAEDQHDPYNMLDRVIDYLKRQQAEAEGLGYAEFLYHQLQDSLSALKIDPGVIPFRSAEVRQ